MADAPPPVPRESYLFPSLLVLALLVLVCGAAVLYRHLATSRRIDIETRAEIVRLQLEARFLRQGLADYARLTGWDLDTLKADLGRLKVEVGGGEEVRTCADVLAAWRDRAQVREAKPGPP